MPAVSKAFRFLLILNFWTLLAAAGAQGQVRISGQLDRLEASQAIVRYFTSELDAEPTIWRANVDGHGRFEMEFPLDRPVEAYFEAGNQQTRLFLEPGDQLELRADLERFDESLRYRGKRSSRGNNSFLAAWILAFEDTDSPAHFTLESRMAQLQPHEFSLLADSLLARQLDFLDRQARRSKPSRGFLAYQREQILFQDAIARYAYAGKYTYHGNELEDSYFQFLYRLNPQTALPFLSESYLEFLFYYLPYELSRGNDTRAMPQEQYLVELYNFTRGNLQGLPAYSVCTSILRAGLEDYSPRYASLVEDFLATCPYPRHRELIEWLSQEALRVQPGRPAPDFSLPDARGQMQRFSELARGKRVYLYFWSIWCVPCQNQLQRLEAFLRENPAQDLLVVSVCLDNNIRGWEAWSRGLNPPGAHLYDGAETANTGELWGVKQMPHAYWIAPDGTILLNPAPTPEQTEEFSRMVLGH